MFVRWIAEKTQAKRGSCGTSKIYAVSVYGVTTGSAGSCSTGVNPSLVIELGSSREQTMSTTLRADPLRCCTTHVHKSTSCLHIERVVQL